MSELIFVTSNEGKISEARHVLAPLGFQLHAVSFDFTEPRSGTIREVALEKLQQIIDQGYDRVFVEDSGIFFAAYDQFPGVLSKRVFQGIGYKGLEKLLKHESKKAWFTGTIALYWQGNIKTFSTTTHGHIVHKLAHIMPESGLPFDPIFVPAGEQRVLRELSVDERTQHSYRKKALQKMIDWIIKNDVVTQFPRRC